MFPCTNGGDVRELNGVVMNLDKVIDDFNAKLDKIHAEQVNKLKGIEASLKSQKEIESTLRAEVDETNKRRKACEESYNAKTAEIVKLRESLQTELATRIKLLDDIKAKEVAAQASLDNARYFSGQKHEELEEQKRITAELAHKGTLLDRLIRENQDKAKTFDTRMKDALALISENTAKQEKLARLERMLNDRETELDKRSTELKRIAKIYDGRKSE